jgi:hypothetical protein
LASIGITPATPSVPAGLTQQLHATGTYSDGSTDDLTTKVAWTSNATQFATVNSASGVATGAAIGSTVITATSGSVSGTATLAVTAAVPVSLAVSSNPVQTWVSSFLVPTVTETFSDGTTKALAFYGLESDTPAVADVALFYVLGKSVGSATLTVSADSLTTKVPVNVAVSPWTATGPMSVSRSGHTATLLADGKVLAAAGFTTDAIGNSLNLSSSDVYDPSSKTWAASGSLQTARGGHSATLLKNGKVLVTGGYTGFLSQALASTEIYDPTTGAWTAGASLTTARFSHSATLLPDGTVLVAGGNTIANQNGVVFPVLTSAEIYDPVTDAWTPTGSFTTIQGPFTTTLLPNGTVLAISAGASHPPGAEVFDPATGRWNSIATPTLTAGIWASVLLNDGTVLVFGGTTAPSGYTSATIYDPAANTWSAKGNFAFPSNQSFDPVLLSNGTVLIDSSASYSGVNQFSGGTYLVPVIYDPKAGTATPTANYPYGGDGGSVTALQDGSILIAGGDTGLARTNSALRKAVLYKAP